MTGSDIVLDTSAVVKMLNSHELAARFLGSVGRVHLPAIAAGELLYGAANSQRRETNLPRFRQFIEHCEMIDITLATADVYARTRLRLKEAGKPIPEADIWIAATAIEHGLSLATADHHFVHVKDLSLVPFDWSNLT